MNIEKLKFKEMSIPSLTFDLIMIGFLICIIGVSMNFVAVQSNYGRMPVWSSYQYETATHFTINNISEVNNLQFTDIFHIYNGVWSLGDLFMLVGCVFMMLGTIIMIYNLTLNIFIKLNNRRNKNVKRTRRN